MLAEIVVCCSFLWYVNKMKSWLDWLDRIDYDVFIIRKWGYNSYL